MFSQKKFITYTHVSHTILNENIKIDKNKNKKTRRYNGDNGKDVDVQLKPWVGNYRYK